MNIEDLAAWGEFLGGIAVITGLIYLAIQIRESNIQAKVDSNQRFAESISQFGLLPATDRELADIFLRGLEGLDKLQGTDRMRFITFISNGMLRTFENLYFEHLAGRLEQRIWIGAERMLLVTVGAEGFQDVWEMRRTWFEENFQEYIDSLVRDNVYDKELYRNYTGRDV